MKKTYPIEVDCANCAAKMEQMSGKIDGIVKATISVMAQKVTVEFEDGADEKSTLAAFEKACRKIHRQTSITY